MGLEVPVVTVEPVEKYQFNGFELYPKQRALWRDGVRIAVMPKPIQTLLFLVERAGQTVTKEDLLAQIWNGAAVEENNLTQSIVRPLCSPRLCGEFIPLHSRETSAQLVFELSYVRTPGDS